MLSKKMQDAINDQINAEIASGYIYLSMSAYFESQNLPGFANLKFVHYQEELTHAHKFFHYVHSRGGRVTLKKIETPTPTWKSPLEVAEHTLKHEQYVTSRINKLLELAREEKDYATESMLQWYIDEQAEEEENAMKLVDTLKMAGSDKSALLMLDKEFANVKFVDETQPAGV
ncbi:ferritin [Pseudomonadota bacterium]